MEENTANNNDNKEPSSNNLGNTFKDFITSLWDFLQATLSFADEVDKEATVKGIKNEIEFKGFNIWILIFSIIIASIGLNTNSTAVIIGAMLISPLMGPIMGIGLSMGTNDWSTLVRSFKSLLITVGVSLAASTFYFMLTPLGEAGDELLGRTHPELRDVFIAIFGGLAGIMANTRNKVTNVIPGVAIATALMPPLCTAGYGIAKGNWEFFSGAFYLFTINSVYIALTSFIVIRYLKFPLVHFVDQTREKKYKRYIALFSVLIILPSIWTFWKSYEKNDFENSAEEFITHFFNDEDIRYKKVQFNDDKKSTINVFLYSTAKFDYDAYRSALVKFDLDTSDVDLMISENSEHEEVLAKIEEAKAQRLQFSEEKFFENLNEIKVLNEQKDSLESEIRGIRGDTIPFVQISQELKILFTEVKEFEYGVYQVTDFKIKKEVPTFHITWKRKLRSNKVNEKKIKEWLKKKLQLKDVRVMSY